MKRYQAGGSINNGNGTENRRNRNFAMTNKQVNTDSKRRRLIRKQSNKLRMLGSKKSVNTRMKLQEQKQANKNKRLLDNKRDNMGKQARALRTRQMTTRGDTYTRTTTTTGTPVRPTSTSMGGVNTTNPTGGQASGY